MLLKIYFLFASFCPFLFSFNLVLFFVLFLSLTEGSESFMLMFNKGSTEGTNS